MMTRSMYRGFTLIELMMVVAIIGILAMIAIPVYKDITAKSRRAEVITNLSALQLAQAGWRTNHSTYTATIFGPTGLGYATTVLHGTASDPKYYTYAVANNSGTGYRITGTRKSGTAQADDKCGNYVMSVTGNTAVKKVDTTTDKAVWKACWSQ